MLPISIRRGRVSAPLPLSLLLLFFFAIAGSAADVRLTDEVPLGTAIAGPPPFQQSLQALASNGVDYLAVWSDFRSIVPSFSTTQRPLYAGRLGADGHPLDPPGHPIGEGTVVALTWSGSSYFVLFAGAGFGGGFIGRQLDVDGNPVGTAVYFDLTAPPRDVATNGRNYAVVQYGGFVTVADPGGRVIWKEMLPDPLATSPIVVLPGGDYRFVAVTGSGAAVVTVDGTTGMATTTPLPFANAAAAAAVSDGNGRFLIAWIDGGTAGYEIVSGSTGHLLAGPSALGPTDASGVAAAWDGSEFLIVLRSATALRATRLGASGQLIATVTLDGTSSLPRFARGGSGVAMAWDADAGNDQNVYDRAAANFAALLSAPVDSVAQTPTVQRAPRLAGAFAVWQEGVNPLTVMAQAPGKEPAALAQMDPFTMPPVVARGGDSYLVAWIDNLSLPGSRIAAKRIALDGAPIDAEPFVVASEAPDGLLIQPQVVALASDGPTFLVVWANANGNLRAVRVGHDGQVLDGQPIAIWDRGFGSSAVSLIRAVWSGTHFVVSWVDQSLYFGGISPPPAMPGTLYAAGVTAEGAPASAPQPLWTGYAARSLAVAATGSNVALLWPANTLRNNGDLCLDALTLKNDGALLAPLSELRCTATRYGDVPPYRDVGVAWDGDELVSVFTDAQNTIEALRLDASLAPIDAAPFAVSAAGLTAAQPDVSATSNGVAIAYTRLAPEAPYGNVQRAFERTLLRLHVPPRVRAVR